MAQAGGAPPRTQPLDRRSPLTVATDGCASGQSSFAFINHFPHIFYPSLPSRNGPSRAPNLAELSPFSGAISIYFPLIIPPASFSFWDTSVGVLHRMLHLESPRTNDTLRTVFRRLGFVVLGKSVPGIARAFTAAQRVASCLERGGGFVLISLELWSPGLVACFPPLVLLIHLHITSSLPPLSSSPYARSRLAK